ncbi:DUF1302 family protein [Crenobacter sp. SG2305]|uniref:DUF1302 domain-containing protein n=1 Tax=Crenobacter oryzisoli TaxID=3056844 RepID=UPI0025AA4C72|nr:DUF1302 family protein [Crenobacter sp. SG2305]MDN0083785.1 DUF1302 family protein [Crenobacter sp. SG2305]
MQKNNIINFKLKLPVLTAATVAALTVMSAQAFEFGAENSDLTGHWDTAVKLDLSRRTSSQDPHIAKSPNYNDGDLNFNKGEFTSERIDLFSQFELDYKHKMGVRVSGAAWYDAAYDNLNNPNPTPNHLVNGKPTVGLSGYTDRYAHGPSGELLEAYAFRNFDLGGQQKLDITAGKSLQSWGNSTQTLLHGINYGQYAYDLGKLYGVPRNEPQEVFLPREQVTADYTLSPQWSFGGEYFLDWQHSRFPEAGSYLGMYDLALDGGETAYVPNIPGGLAFRGYDLTPNKTGDFGVNTKWSPSWFGGSISLIYRRTSDTLPDTVILDPVRKQYHIAYANDIDIYGLSLSKVIAGNKVGMDVSYRDNMPLASQPILTVSPAKAGQPGFIAAIPQQGDTGGAVGKTLHVALNDTKVFGKTPLFDKAFLQAELTYNRLLSVTEGFAQYRGNSAYTGIDKSTREFFGMNAYFAPTWNQVFPGVDLSMPLVYSTGISGESAVPLGGNKGTGSYSAGIGALVNSKYQIDLRYTAFFGGYRVAPNGTISSYAGLSALLSDRNNVLLTFKTKF